MSDPRPTRNFAFGRTDKQVRNRYSSAGITAREAARLISYMDKIRDIATKKNLYVGYERKLLDAAQLIEDLLIETERL